MMARRKYVVGNWKMNGLAASIDEARAIFDGARAHGAVDVALCPPFTLVAAMAAAAPGGAVGGQDCHSAASGAYTGSVSAPMLADAGAVLVIVGHSERREGFGESDVDVRAKAEAAMAAGLAVILCVGEPRGVRESGGAIDYVLAQVAGSLPAEFDPARLAIAYEPIWADWCRRSAMSRRCTARSARSSMRRSAPMRRRRCGCSTAVRSTATMPPNCLGRATSMARLSAGRA